MKVSGSLYVATALLVSVLSAPLFLESVSNPSVAASSLKPSRAAETRLFGPLTPTRYAAAAQALRKKDLQSSRQLLEKVAQEHPVEKISARLVSGLYSYEAHDYLHAQELLASAPTPGGALEDWRLLLLAASATARGEQEVAQKAYADLLSGCPLSPLRGQTYVEAADLAYRQGRSEEVLALVAAARREGIGGEAAGRLEDLALQIAKERSDPSLLREASRRLWITAPLSASSRAISRSFHSFGEGGEDGGLLPTVDELKRRAVSFLDGSRLAQAAATTLSSIPEAERDTEWHLLQARALIASRRGQEALAVLAGASPAGVAEQASLEEARTEAATVAAAALGGRRASAADRERLLEEAASHLKTALQLGGGGLQPETVKHLYTQLQETGQGEEALDVLRALRRIDPADTTGAAALWERGWNAYRGGDDGAAIAAWKLLEEIYPGSGDAQRGLYWQARALDRSGRADEARGLYREIVATADTADFYGRQALARLGQEPTPDWAGVRVRSAGAWRIDPLLAQAKLLTDLGLDGLAQRDMDLAGKRANARDLLALKALILGRQGQQAESLVLLREAFPALGTAYQAAVPQEILRAYYPLEYAEAIRASAEREHIPAWLVAGVIRQESAFNPRATSRVGARGLMQLMPDTARDIARRLGLPYRPEELYDPEMSLRLGTAYLHELIDDFHGNWELALAGYNGGPNRIERLWQKSALPQAMSPGAGLDDFVETLALDESKSYVKRILVLADSYRQLYPEAG